MLPVHMGKTFTFVEGTLVVASKDDWDAMSSMKGIGLNLATLLYAIHYQL